MSEISDSSRDHLVDAEFGDDFDDEPAGPPPTVRQLRRGALARDALLFACAFTAGALAYAVIRGILSFATDRTDDFWTISLSEDLIFVGLMVGELFLLWNNGVRQGIRGHSMGKHRMGLAVVDTETEQPTGAVRGLVRGLIIVVLLDLSLAAIPVGLPTALRRLTPESWHLGFTTYVALALLAIPVLISLDRRLADVVTRTKVVETGATTSQRRGVVVSGLEIIGVIGVLGLAVAYIAFYSPLIRFPELW